MAVKIRLTRIGKKQQPSYRVVVADARSPRDGAYIEQIGRYDPRQEPSVVEIDNERASYWIARGAQPSSQVKKLLEISGAVAARQVRAGRVHVIGEAAPEQRAEEAAGPVTAGAMPTTIAEEMPTPVEAGIEVGEPTADPGEEPS